MVIHFFNLVTLTLKFDLLLNTFYSRGLYFRVNSREHRDAKIKSSPIISIIMIKEEDMTNRENKVSCINLG